MNIYSHASDAKMTKPPVATIKRCQFKASSTLNILGEEAARRACVLPGHGRTERAKVKNVQPQVAFRALLSPDSPK